MKTSMLMLASVLCFLNACSGAMNTNNASGTANANMNANASINASINSNAGNMNANGDVNMNGVMNHNANTPRPTPAASPGITPQATPGPAATPPSKIDEILASMDIGNIAFNVPPSMSLQKPETVVLLLSPKQTAEELGQKLRDEGVVGDIKDARGIKIHDRMQAVLSGDGFQITPVTTSDTLPISRQEPTQWTWDVRAERAGTLKLNLVLNAIVDLDDGSGPHPRLIRTFSQTYDVKVSWRDRAIPTFFKNNWQWLWASLLVPVGAWAWNRKRKKRGAARRLFSASQGPGIFISYRREDTAGHVGRLHDALASHFGADRVFKDIDSIGYGDDFVEAVGKAVSSSAVLLVVIGRQWLSITDKQGNRRLDNPQDFVHLEIATALTRGVKVIPALVEGAAMPGDDLLPEPLAKLARRNAIELSDSRWQFDVGRLIEALEDELERNPAPPRPQRPA